VSCWEVGTSATDSGGCDLNEDLVAREVRTRCGGAGDVAVIEAFEDFEGRHD
jgi:hypothetical protein